MKNQYVGDIGDYGKYDLLRAFAEAGIKVGINWYLTENDDSNDGKFTEYLWDDSFRKYSPVVFDALKDIAERNDKSINDIEGSGIITGTIFYSKPLDAKGSPKEREAERIEWFRKSVYALKDAELIYMDPDNGLMKNNDPCKRGAEKYVLPDEIEQYYRAGHNVVYYCHRGRRNLWDWDEYKSYMCKVLPDAKPIVLTYHKGTQRSYIFLIHPEDLEKYYSVVYKVLDRWGCIFSEEYTGNDKTADQRAGDKFCIENSDGSVITLYKRADGWIQIENSKVKDMKKALRPEDISNLLWR